MTPTTQIEKIYRIWSDAKEAQIAVRVQFTVEENGTANTLIRLGAREEWS